jgi:hypothetical protein
MPNTPSIPYTSSTSTYHSPFPNGEEVGAERPLLSSTYFGPIQWYQKLFRHHCLLEQHEHFVKQTFRNRCVIATANGVQALSIPIEQFEGNKCAMKDIRISDHGNWRHLHWNALCSAYGESPFFEYLADDLHPFFEKRWEFLFDYNLEITYKICELLDFEPHITLTDAYQPAADDTPEAMTDLRDAIRPKHPLPDAAFTPRPYHQVYEARWGFQPNLSVLDLLCNTGREGVLYL